MLSLSQNEMQESEIFNFKTFSLIFDISDGIFPPFSLILITFLNLQESSGREESSYQKFQVPLFSSQCDASLII